MVKHERLHVAALGMAVRRTRRAEPVQVALPAPKVVHPLLLASTASFSLPYRPVPTLPPPLLLIGELNSEARLDLLAREQHCSVHDQRPPRPDPASRALGEYRLRGLAYGMMWLGLLPLGFGGGRTGSTASVVVVAIAAAASGCCCGRQGLKEKPRIRPEASHLVPGSKIVGAHLGKKERMVQCLGGFRSWVCM